MTPDELEHRFDTVEGVTPPGEQTLFFPQTPEEIPEGYGDLVSSIIWYPKRTENGSIYCRNCSYVFAAHDPDDGACQNELLVRAQHGNR